MLRSFIRRFFEPRHYWRSVGFDELSELYVSQLLRSLGVSLIGIFAPIYLYKLGYSIQDIALFNVFWFLLRPIFDIANAFLIGKIGPKHSMLLAALLHVGYLGLLISLPDLKWPLMLVAVIGSEAYGLYLLSIQVDFSKVKHAKHGGEELGYLTIVDKIGGILGPLVGGLIASFYDPRYTIALSMLVLIASIFPLFISNEPVRVNQDVTFRKLKIKEHIRDYISVIPFTLENSVSLIIWPLYAAIFLLGSNVFAKLGGIITVSTISMIFLSRAIGRVIDKSRGRDLLRLGTVVNAFLHLVRPFVTNITGVLAVGVINEPITASYRMPYMKGYFDASDSQPGYRIAYLSSVCATDSATRLLLWLALWILLGVFSAKSVLVGTFYAASIFSLGIMSERYRALDR